MLKFNVLVLASLLLSTVFSIGVHADEGMWLLNAFPSKKVEAKYGFNADQKWLNHVQLSSARLAAGCSGSFVSKDGLIMTNHHCARGCVQQLSTANQDFIADGFYAKNLSDEPKCPSMEINQLVSITDVTTQINQATKGLDGQKYSDVLKSVTAQVEKECSKGQDNLRCEVVTLFHGGLYHLYQYKRYQDVRLVMAPESSMAFFGGDPDNFNFPRYDLDISFVRVYENGKPLKADSYFKWSKDGAKKDELVFVTGHPGHTDRLLTIAELETLRDLQLPFAIASSAELRGFLTGFQNRGKEEKRISSDLLFGVENRLKAFKGRFATLLDPAFFSQKIKNEQKLQNSVKKNARLNKEVGSAWSQIAKAEIQFRGLYLPLVSLEANSNFNSALFGHARTLIRAARELSKPNGERLKEYTDSKIPELKQRLFSTAPIYPSLEAAMLGYSLTKFRENLTADHPVVKRIFAKESPTDLAERLVKDTHLADLNYRKKLFEGGWDAISKSNDPMIQFALSIDNDARAVRKTYEDQIESVIKKNSEKIANAQFKIQGSDTYPDATFTLRISYGQVKGYNENGKLIEPFTTIGGAYERNTGYDPFKLPNSWMKAKDKMNLSTPLNFCSTNDIIGGNSGSPVINSNGEIVGLIFDGNIQSLGGDFGYDGSVNRAVAVHSAGILEALQKVYGADRIVNELTQ